ncbi:unnamed protein product [Calicophoron daubneyi]|uniref:Uncharacterized protein n=1 Tax=Calicophoron daubneyi TaxID=300641 RepID=A0AAV2TL58_CALDB
MCRNAWLPLFGTLVLVIGIVATVFGIWLRWNQPKLRRIIGPGIGENRNYTDVDAQTTKNRFDAAIQNIGSTFGLALFIFGLILITIAVIACVGSCCKFKILVIMNGRKI